MLVLFDITRNFTVILAMVLAMRFLAWAGLVGRAYIDGGKPAVEARVAADYYGADFAVYEAREAQSLGSYSAFRGRSQAELQAAMVKCRARAARWVKRHDRYILWAVEKGAEIARKRGVR